MTTKTVVLRRLHPAHHQLTPFGAWLHKYHRALDVVGVALIFLAGFSVVLQLLYPASRALPLTSIGGIGIGGQSAASIATELKKYAENGEVTVVTPLTQFRAKWQEIGLSVDAEASAEAAINYPTWERLIPFSGVIKVFESQTQPLVASVEPDHLEDFAAQVVKGHKLAAKDATISVVNGTVVVDSAAEGYAYTPDSVAAQIQATAMSSESRLNLVPEQVPYKRSASELAGLQATAEAILGKRLTLKFGGKTYQPTDVEIGEWLNFSENAETAEMTMFVSGGSIAQYLKKIDEEHGIKPGVSNVTLRDGVEIARTPAANGQTVAHVQMQRAIITALEGDGQTPVIELTAKPVGPQLSFIRTYSNTDKGLLAVIKDWKRDYPGNSSVLVRELGGEKRYAAIAPNTVYVPASTFKLFVYLGIATKIADGVINYDTVTDMGWTINDCLQEMIVVSTNPCAISFMNLIGWQWTEDYAHARGFKHTYLNNYGGGDKTTTLRDETNYLLKLYFGSLMEKESRDRLLNYMKRQKHRAGIPSGVPGVTVANKVGRYDGWLHDVAIVYGPKSKYILGVMTRGYDYSDFAELSRRVYSFLQ